MPVASLLPLLLRMVTLGCLLLVALPVAGLMIQAGIRVGQSRDPRARRRLHDPIRQAVRTVAARFEDRGGPAASRRTCGGEATLTLDPLGVGALAPTGRRLYGAVPTSFASPGGGNGRCRPRSCIGSTAGRDEGCAHRTVQPPSGDRLSGADRKSPPATATRRWPRPAASAGSPTRGRAGSRPGPRAGSARRGRRVPGSPPPTCRSGAGSPRGPAASPSRRRSSRGPWR